VAAALCLAGLPLTLASGCSRDAEASQDDPATPVQSAATVEVAGGEAAVSYDPRESLAPMIERVAPAVVSIQASGRAVRGIFGATEGHAGGSGFVLSADGTVITNHHVVDGAKELEVRLPDGRKFAAELVGSDPATDLAVLQLRDADELPVVELGDSAAMHVGDWVVAIGSPMGLEHSATVGILSARGRGHLGLYDGDSYLDFLQTDADIAPGSSGGPLFDLHGRVVGITTAVGAGSRPGFAIPVDQAKEIIPEIRKEGRVVRGWLGASNEPDDDSSDGARVGQVFEGTPAADAGLRRGDVIKKVDGGKIADFDALRRVIARLDPGHTVLLEVERDGKIEELTAVLGERPARDDLGRFERAPSDPRPPRGLAPPTPPSSPDFGDRLGVQAREAEGGLEVVRVEPGSMAEDLDLQPGDLITRLNGEEIATAVDVSEALGRSRDKIDIEVMRDGVKHRVSLERS
jgi:serine protease Do